MERGFFSLDEMETYSSDICRGELNCKKCGLYRYVSSPKMSYTGKGEKRCLIIVEAPGRIEDETGIQLTGDAGQLERRKLAKYGLDLDRDFWKINAVNCRPMNQEGNNRAPTKNEIRSCRFMVDETIKKLKPKFIWLMGGSAVESLYMGRFSNLSISRWRKFCIPDPVTKAWIIPMYHPSYLLRNINDRGLKSTFEGDLKWAVSCLRRNYPKFPDYEKKVIQITDFAELEERLGCLSDSQKNIAFDYETTGLKSQPQGQKVWTISYCDGDYSYAFPISYPHWKNSELNKIIKSWSLILKNPKIGKIAHNLIFEDSWSRSIFSTPVKNWIMCTMNAAHVIDSRSYGTALEFLAYVYFGKYPYGAEIKRYMKTVKGGKINSIDKCPLDKVLIYNGLDSLFSYLLYKEFVKVFSRKKYFKKAYSFFHEGLQTFTDLHMEGISVNSKYYLKREERLLKKKQHLLKYLKRSKNIVRFELSAGRSFNYNTDEDLKELFFKIMKLKPYKLTDNKNLSVDKEVLNSYNKEEPNKIVEIRELDKIVGTYFAQVKREICEGKIHPYTNLHIPQTYRSSMDSPNFQNIPARNKKAKKEVRGGIIPLPGFQICEFDYASLEVRIIACFTEDESLVNYIYDPHSDMHRDQSEKLFLLPSNEITGAIRDQGKSGFVFPEFYGSYYKTCAHEIWKEIPNLKTVSGKPLLSHLREEGIKQFQDFENHVKGVEERFWYRFPDVKSWQEEVLRT